MSTYLIIAVAAVISIWTIVVFNTFVSRVYGVNTAWANVTVQLKRRYDLIPDLVETVKGYATHESSAFEDVSKARSAAMGATTTLDKALAESQLASATKSLLAVAEAYPDLKANTNFLELQKSLVGIEDSIQESLSHYNGSVRDLNVAAEAYLGKNLFRFKKMDLFELRASDVVAKEPAEVRF